MHRGALFVLGALAKVCRPSWNSANISAARAMSIAGWLTGQTATIEHRMDFDPKNGSTVALSMTAGKCFVFDDQGLRLR